MVKALYISFFILMNSCVFGEKVKLEIEKSTFICYTKKTEQQSGGDHLCKFSLSIVDENGEKLTEKPILVVTQNQSSTQGMEETNPECTEIDLTINEKQIKLEKENEISETFFKENVNFDIIKEYSEATKGILHATFDVSKDAGCKVNIINPFIRLIV